MTTMQANSATNLTESCSALTKSALLASNNLAETCATLALARACSHLRLAVANYERAGCGQRVTHRCATQSRASRLLSKRRRAGSDVLLFRCPECRTRRRDYGLFTQHLRATGHRLCRCGGYLYEHRPGSPFCEHNPMSAALLASRYGASDEEVLDIALEIVLTTPGRAVAACPF